MKKFALIIIAIICMAIPCFANQGEKPKEEMRKELREFKMKYLAQEMDLRSDQQQKFFQTYSAMQDEKHKIFSEARSFERKVKKNPEATDADYTKASKLMADAKIKEGEIDKKYDAIFAKFLTSKQIYKMKEAEKTFRQKMQEMRKNKKKK
ncbi:MAG: hypothetical protein NC201_01595 [Prevotella sp.]|nr:hypothetical protein [Bacteroides sp.]MCM1365922.1 hypothetical protein [Prevotella sp.]MCM1436657.1 hypothetical protein [Prevotella sp.]